tara:strand:+ start:240 stop:689 length:450 start_codon:yes stop_codon:yes gene_type:complete
MSDYSFMKSGFDLMQPDDEEFKKNATTVIVAYAENALRTAAMYVSHHKTRKGITPEDIKRAMMMEMFLFKNRPNMLEKAEEIREMLFGEQEESDSDEEDLSNMEDEDEFSENDCTCPVCRVMNNIYIRWEGWTPNTLFETTIKKHIDNM